MDNNTKKYKDINQNDFMSEVIESSKDILVVVDFFPLTIFVNIKSYF